MTFAQLAKSLCAILLVGQLPIAGADRLRVNRIRSVSYESFLQTYSQHGSEKVSSLSHDHRRQLFEARKVDALAHNAQNKSWKKAINLFSDFTEEELKSRLGYKRVGGRWDQSASSFLEKEDSNIDQIDISKLAASVDWRARLNSSNLVHNQGGCGSCWAHAAVAAMEAAAELHGGFQGNLSTDQIVKCTPNPRHCGGTGGCQGATSEMAFERARRFGMIRVEDYAKLTADNACSEQSHPAVQVSSFVRLPENRASHLLHAVGTHGPVVVSVDAGPIFSYGSGVFSGCDKDALVNHAVVAVGYGREDDKDYWLIKNSWGDSWGEQGYFRLERHAEGEYCGIDNKPKDGVYCDNAPAEIKVCGMCGIYSDSSYPVISGAATLTGGAMNLVQAASHAF